MHFRAPSLYIYIMDLVFKHLLLLTCVYLLKVVCLVLLIFSSDMHFKILDCTSSLVCFSGALVSIR